MLGTAFNITFNQASLNQQLSNIILWNHPWSYHAPNLKHIILNIYKSPYAVSYMLNYMMILSYEKNVQELSFQLQTMLASCVRKSMMLVSYVQKFVKLVSYDQKMTLVLFSQMSDFDGFWVLWHRDWLCLRHYLNVQFYGHINRKEVCLSLKVITRHENKYINRNKLNVKRI